MDDFPDWSVFQERETLALAGELLSPAAEIAAVLRTTSARLARAEQLLREAEQNDFSRLAQLAVLAAQLGMLLERNAGVFGGNAAVTHQEELASVYKSLQIIQKQMLAFLRKAGLEIELPLAKTYAEVAGCVEIEEWQHHQNFVEERVIDVIEPVVRKGLWLRAGRVVMGAPLAARPQNNHDESGTRECDL